LDTSSISLDASDPNYLLTPSLFHHRILPRDLTRDKALGDVAGFQIKVSIDRADLAGDAEARDRFFLRIQRAL